MKAYMGIDPGASGAIVVIAEDGTIKSIRFSNTTEKMVWDFVNDVSFTYDCFCVLELVGAMPGQGVTSMFSFGDSVGFIRGILTCAAIPFERKVPRAWQKACGISPRITGKKEGETEETKTEFKRRVRQIAERLYPGVKMNNELADALLIAHFCKLTHTK